ncbi:MULTISPECIES: hypothetical protein [Aeromonas]|jgi:hypothetical protein|uniref:Uncharacterized protein n=2 Tax=Aeromonadaceae TaxID=84642 RepID=A0ABT7PX39_9GAMM|nr:MULTISPECIES: hypothetical protein [Aeromonas]KFN20234.1 hypothetical protein JM66_06190 [Aeromonas bestiarum]MDM5071652.1 hypothetical protein [Aeromonas bestiarum]
MALAIASLLWLAAFAAAEVGAAVRQASVGQGAAMQLHEPSDPGFVNSVSLPPGGQWRLSFEQGRRLESAGHPELYQMLLAWFQHEILGLLCGLLFFLPLIYLRQLSDYFGYLHKRLLVCHHLQFRFCHGHSRPACC